MMAKQNTEGKVQTIEGKLILDRCPVCDVDRVKKYAIKLTFLSTRTGKHIELQLYLIILLGQKDRHADALALLEGEIGFKTKATENVELRHLRNELLIKTGRWKDARDATALILKEKYVAPCVSPGLI